MLLLDVFPAFCHRGSRYSRAQAPLPRRSAGVRMSPGSRPNFMDSIPGGSRLRVRTFAICRRAAGTFPSAPGWMVWLVAIAALAAMPLGDASRANGGRSDCCDSWRRLASSAVATSGFMPRMAGGDRMKIRCVFGCSGHWTLITCDWRSRWLLGIASRQRTELVWTAYGVLAFVSAKLLFEYLPHGLFRADCGFNFPLCARLDSGSPRGASARPVTLSIPAHLAFTTSLLRMRRKRNRDRIRRPCLTCGSVVKMTSRGEIAFVGRAVLP